MERDDKGEFGAFMALVRRLGLPEDFDRWGPDEETRLLEGNPLMRRKLAKAFREKGGRAYDREEFRREYGLD